MLNLRSVVDGFKVIIGSFLIHIAALLAMAIAVRPADYPEDVDRTERAKTTYIYLMVLHAALAVVKYIKMFMNDHVNILSPVFMLIEVVVMTDLCGNWVFIKDKVATTRE